MDAQAISLLAIFEKKHRLEVPLFQRQYVWSRERQWEPLWEDIARKFTEKLEGRADAPAHFLGAMVLDQKQTPITHVEKRQVIDGQQRLTTLQIFIAAFRDFCDHHKCEDLARECEGYTLNRGMMADPKVDCFKVWPTQLDRPQFADVISSRSREELERRYPEKKKKFSRKPEPRPLMVEAYLYFHDCLTEFFIGSESETAMKSETPLTMRLEECFHALKNTLRVVAIDLQPGDDPQVIFETLNARGEPLLPADLLRNYIFLRAARDVENSEELYEKYWRGFDDTFWREEIKQGRLTRPRSDLFMQHFLASHVGEDIPVKHLFVEYKHWIEGKHPFKTVTIELAVLAKHGAYFRRILQPEHTDPVYSLSVFLDAFDIRTAYPFLLMLMDAQLSEESWEGITRCLKSYLLRRAVCRLSTKNYNRIFLQLTKNLRREGVSENSLRAQLLSQKGESAEWPDDSKFKQAWMNEPAYDLGNAKLVYILSRLSETYLSSKTESLTCSDQLSIEHIMPKAWTGSWPLMDGTKGVVFDEIDEVPDGDERWRLTRARIQSVQTFGNLTILTQALNSAQSNSAWKEKKSALQLHSLLPINLNLAGYENWDENAIKSRGEELFGRATGLWTR